MRKYLEAVRTRAKGFSNFEIKQISRADNTDADVLSRIGSKRKDSASFAVIDIEEPSYKRQVVACVTTEPNWMTPIVQYLQDGTLPTEKNEAKKLRRKAAMYAMRNGTLYRRASSGAFLRCLSSTEAMEVTAELHSGVCGNHIGARSLAHKILRQGYFWPTLKKETEDLVLKCKNCQRHGGWPHQPVAELTPMTSPWPFAQWGLDILGPFPLAPGQKKFAYVAVDYFTKWPEAEAVAKITDYTARKFVLQNIISRFGTPNTIVTDNGTQFSSTAFRGFCQKWGIVLAQTSVSYPQSNGMAELTNRNIVWALRTRLEGAKGMWADELPYVLWGLRTTRKTATGQTPYNLTFGAEAVLPIELDIPTYRVQQYDPTTNSEAMAAETDLLEENRDEAALRASAFQQAMVDYHRKRVKHRSFQDGDLVLRSLPATGQHVSKLDEKWDGPFVVVEQVSPATYRLAWPDGRRLNRPWNAAHLKKYYQ